MFKYVCVDADLLGEEHGVFAASIRSYIAFKHCRSFWYNGPVSMVISTCLLGTLAHCHQDPEPMLFVVFPHIH